jgi:hypothetical protein
MPNEGIGAPESDQVPSPAWPGGIALSRRCQRSQNESSAHQKETSMRYSKPIVAILTAGLLSGIAVPHVASAGPLSLHPSACVLARNGTPWDAISGATYANARFTNSSGGTALAYCPMPFQSGVTQFRVYTTSNATVCNMLMNTSSGTSTVVFGSHSSNHWTFSTAAAPGSSVAEIACTLANGTGIHHLVNY